MLPHKHHEVATYGKGLGHISPELPHYLPPKQMPECSPEHKQIFYMFATVIIILSTIEG